MRILLVHPEDSPPSGPWARQQWDLLVDLGKSSGSAAEEWRKQFRCPVLRLDTLREPIKDLVLVAHMMRVGRGRLIDAEEIDWWELTSILIHADLELAVLLQRLAPALSGKNELSATRADWPVSLLAAILKKEVRSLGRSQFRFTQRLRHYRRMLGTFSWPQISEILCDKYDARYKWRHIFSRRLPSSDNPVVLVPTAYTNVSRMAAAYARMLPEQQFLFVATRRSARHFESIANASLADLASYSPTGDSPRELASLLNDWVPLVRQIQHIPEIRLLSKGGRLAGFPDLFRVGLAVRNLWHKVLASEPVTAVFCGDDSNPFTRLPVLLARKRGLATADFHHGALDGRFLLKTLPSDIYLTKSEMERDYLIRVCSLPREKIALAAPRRTLASPARLKSSSLSQIIFFSEPYESAGARAEGIYRELLPRLAQLARESAKNLVIKLHPFESIARRRRLLKTVLAPQDRAMTELIDGPLDQEVLSKAWFGITIESTAAIDCALQGVPCFLCEWLGLSSYGYIQQYARFEVGSILHSADGIRNIPRLLANWCSPHSRESIWHTAEPNLLRQYLAGIGTMADSREERRQEPCSVSYEHRATNAYNS